MYDCTIVRESFPISLCTRGSKKYEKNIELPFCNRTIVHPHCWLSRLRRRHSLSPPPQVALRFCRRQPTPHDELETALIATLEFVHVLQGGN